MVGCSETEQDRGCDVEICWHGFVFFYVYVFGFVDTPFQPNAPEAEL